MALQRAAAPDAGRRLRRGGRRARTRGERSRRRPSAGASGASTSQDRFTFRLTLDGSLRFRLAGPRAANYDLEVRADGHLEGRTRAPGSRDKLGWEAACVQAPETIAVTVHRRSGAGPYTLRVTSAG